ncbi:U3 small nucleolar ribonucleoprotein complex, subunit Mpp10 [Suillus subaureus]|uniref:U3 small nucleolar ribonucleoprotein protein MPP10 n=1 Tax=Suillus subaureus TaxID=48587 RepID=A0A9P7JJK5_9AGAM|nr:U3 small nucleolar ribonucleoprotein complex, subunit Mpp10 [Suillus subaureus]KAG1825971.1 U3 small nucleolar ribonucleoprotein complex, subunit Mpp10 [Suillus subaureus]
MEIESKVNLPRELDDLSSFIQEKPESLAAATAELQAIALRATKFIFDLALQSEPASLPHIENLLSSLRQSQAPQTRSQTRANAKRKRSPSPVLESPKKVTIKNTPLPSLFIEEMNEDQIWQQLDLRAAPLCSNLLLLEGETEDDMELSDGMYDDAEDEGGDEVSEESEDSEEIEYMEDSGEDTGGAEEMTDLREELSEDEEDCSDHHPSLLDVVKAKPSLKRAAAKQPNSDLDDDFFSLDAFNRETEEAEATTLSRGRLGRESDEDEFDDEGDSIDLFRPIDDAHDLDDDASEDGAEPLYKDFFDAPRGSSSKATMNTSSSKSKVRFSEQVRVKSIKAKGKGLPVSSLMEEDDSDDENGLHMYLEDPDEVMMDAEVEESFVDEYEDEDGDGDGDDEGRVIIERLKDDLFAEEDASDSNMTTYEKRMAALQTQIKELEAENVAKKDWVLTGEATSRSRPQDSLLQEDLEFERTMKAVPVITEAVVQGLEERIKARIKDDRFDDVVRIRAVDDKPFLPSRFFELQDTKSSQSLAQIYEDEYIVAQNGGTGGDDRDGRLKKEHDEITKLWDSICSKLDALCNAHYTPKAPKASISTISNVSAVTLESALPTSKTVSSMLAPEEVFKTASSDPRARSELTPVEKRTLRAKERKARKKTRDALDKSVDKHAKMRGIKKQKDAALKSVVKSGKGVTVVGKKTRDVLKSKNVKGKSY